jgi:hypothetical protein
MPPPRSPTNPHTIIHPNPTGSQIYLPRAQGMVAATNIAESHAGGAAGGAAEPVLEADTHTRLNGRERRGPGGGPVAARRPVDAAQSIAAARSV